VRRCSTCTSARPCERSAILGLQKLAVAVEVEGSHLRGRLADQVTVADEDLVGLCRVGSCRDVTDQWPRARSWLWIAARHNSELLEEGEQRVAGAVAAGFDAGRVVRGEGSFLDGDVGVQVDLGGVGGLVAEPERDNAGIDAGVPGVIAARWRSTCGETVLVAGVGQLRLAVVACLPTSRATASRSSACPRLVGNSGCSGRRARWSSATKATSAAANAVVPHELG
jgi:hypothetical protein